MAVSTSQKIRHSLRESKRGLLGCIIVLGVVILALAAPWISLFDPYQQDLQMRLKPPAWSGSDGIHWMGTDHLGRDIASRVIYGSRVSLIISLSAVSISAFLGISIGLITGYFRGKADAIFMRLADIQLAFPFILLIIAVVAVLGPSMRNIIIVLGITGWVVYARIVRAEVLSLREREFVTAARALGCSHFKIIFPHLLPNVASSCIVVATLEIARMVLIESGLSFLGLGIQPPTPCWGGALADGRVYLFTSWWLATFPGLALMLTILGVNLMGDWLRDLLA
ncbi:MAG: ABC transporter permease [Deltaproteobacteria bacterium]|nr:ABC transporter permease [Deltaproteobacteria bacterium]